MALHVCRSLIRWWFIRYATAFRWAAGVTKGPSKLHYRASPPPRDTSASCFRPQRLQSLGLRYVHPAELGLPFIDAGIADAVITTKLRDQCARLMLLQNTNNLFVGETVALHSLALSMGQSLLQYGLCQRTRSVNPCPESSNRTLAGSLITGWSGF